MKHWRTPLLKGLVLSISLLLVACSGESAAPGESPTPTVSLPPSPNAE